MWPPGEPLTIEVPSPEEQRKDVSNMNRTAISILLAAALPLAACGSSDDESSSPTAPTETADPTSDTAGAPSSAADPVEPAQASTDEADGDDEPWFRDLRVDAWEYAGADPTTMRAIITAIERSDAERAVPGWLDSVVDGDTEWITAWSNAGRAALDEAAATDDDANAMAALADAAQLFTIAAYPQHTDSPAEAEAYAAAEAAYLEWGRRSPWIVEAVDVDVDGATTSVLLHVPDVDGPAPVVLAFGGIDVAKTEHRRLFTDHLAPAGVALVSLDNTGYGSSAGILADRPELERLHRAVLDELERDARLDLDRVGLSGASYGGISAVRLAIGDGRVDAAVAICAPIHGVMEQGADAVEGLPAMTRASLASAIGVAFDDVTTMGDTLVATSLVNDGLIHESEPVTDTPLLAVNTDSDPFVPVADLELVATASTNGEFMVVEGDGHCQPTDTRTPIVADWLLERLGADQGD